MRQITVRNLTSEDWLQRDCLVTERIREGDATTQVTRRCTYRVESRTPLPSLSDTINWARNLDPLPPRKVFVTRDVDPESGGERVVYKVVGHLYIVWGCEVVCVGYRHLLAMHVDPPSDS